MSANHRLHMDLPPTEMDVWWSWSVARLIFSRNKLNRMGESKHPWQIPTVVFKNSPSWQFKRSALLEFSYNASVAWTSPSSMLKYSPSSFWSYMIMLCLKDYANTASGEKGTSKRLCPFWNNTICCLWEKDHQNPKYMHMPNVAYVLNNNLQFELGRKRTYREIQL